MLKVNSEKYKMLCVLKGDETIYEYMARYEPRKN